MTTIRATCPTCGEVDMAPEDIYLAVRGVESSYRFVCPSCAIPIEKAADRKVVALLLSAGVHLGDGRPAAPSIRSGNEDLPPFTRDDLMGFHDLLRHDDLLAELASGT